MAKFKVKVKVVAEYEYETEVDESDFSKAESAGARQWREKMPSDFQVHEDYISEWETDSEQLTADCPRCGVEHPVETSDRPDVIIVNGKRTLRPDVEWWRGDEQYCAACGAKIEAEEKRG